MKVLQLSDHHIGKTDKEARISIVIADDATISKTIVFPS